MADLGLGACLADDMGLGKTLEVLAMLDAWRREAKGRRFRALVVSPASVVPVWVQQCATFCREMKDIAMVGDRRARQKALAKDDYDLLVTHYGLVRSEIAQLSQIRTLEGEPKTVAFFHINTVGAAVVRKPGDYVSKMIAMAGGTYVPAELEVEENALSTMNLQMEAFYYGAKDADILIYNSTIDGKLDSIQQLLSKSALLADFKAVQNGDVWCTEQSMFQQSSASAGMIRDLNAIITGTAESDTLTFLYKLK